MSLTDGSFNNNNKNNQYNVVVVDSEKVTDLVFLAEQDCWKNKHSSFDASKYHYHLSKIFPLIDSLIYDYYQPSTSICFIIKYPKPREIFAAHYGDRIIHHIVAFYLRALAENVHTANGNISFGNRPKVSNYHAALKLQELMKQHPNGYIRKYDIKSFFMSINKEKAYEIFEYFNRKYRPKGFSEEFEKFVKKLLKILLTHNPADNCEKRSPDEFWNLIDKTKSLFYMDGLPIGNFYSQILANLLLAYICELIKDMVEFVDDFVVVRDTIELLNKTDLLFRQSIDFLKLQLSENKICTQPVKRGIKFCGYFVKLNRIYISNRPINNLLRKLEQFEQNVNLSNAQHLQSTINSYFGMMCKCNEFNTQKRLVKRILSGDYKRYFYFKQKHNGFICKIRKYDCNTN